MVVVSDHFIVSKTDSLGKPQDLIKSGINNTTDLKSFLSKNQNTKLEPTDYTLLSKMAPFGVKTLSEWFLDNNSNFYLKLESTLSFNDYKNNDIVFIGQFKSMNISRSLFLKSSKVFSTYQDGFKYTNNNTNKVYNTQHNNLGKVEYAMVSFSSYGNEKQALYFVSNNDIGVMATLNLFTNTEWLKQFEQQLPNKHSYFNALFEVSGLQRTDVSCRLVELEVL